MPFLLILSILACVLAANPARAGDLSAVELRNARKLYIAKCAKCHKLHDPAGYTVSEWASWMAKMSRKARLKKDQEELLSRYLETLRKPGDAPSDASRPGEPPRKSDSR
jgi:hypothetical protein